MRMSVKKILALVLSIVMLLGIFTACGKEEVADPDTPNYTNTATSGVIVVNTGAVFSVRYDTIGNVSGISGDNDQGMLLMEKYTDYEGKATADVIKELVKLSADEKILTDEISTLILKITSGTVFSSDESRDALIKAVQEALTEAGSKAIPMILDDDNLTGEGYLTLATVKTLLMNKLGIDKFDAFYGDTLPLNNYYIVTIELDGVQTSYSIDAYNGFISIATQEELLGDAEAPQDEEVMPDYTEYIDEDISEDDPVQEEDGDIEIPIV